jgi:hypothetical protein
MIRTQNMQPPTVTQMEEQNDCNCKGKDKLAICYIRTNKMSSQGPNHE